jgi:hypothetical protein
LARGVLLNRRKSIPYEKDDCLYTCYAVSNLPAYFFDSIVYYPVTTAVWSFTKPFFYFNAYLISRGGGLWYAELIVRSASLLLF